MVVPIRKLKKKGLKVKFDSFSNIKEQNLDDLLVFQKIITKRSIFKKAFDIVKENLSKGNSYLTNLTFETRIYSNLDLDQLRKVSRSRYKLQYKKKFLSFSPECFVSIKDGQVFSYPMKGTIDADIPDAEKKILQDEKEMAEHTTIVDLIRNDMSQIADDVTVTRFRYIDEIMTHDKRLLQVSSEIRGNLTVDYKKKLGTLLYDLLPAGSISGAPKAKTVKIIKEAENYNRNFYTGVCGYFDGENLDSFVMIRFIERRKGKLYFKSGGGITYLSDLASEYQEMIDKVYVPID